MIKYDAQDAKNQQQKIQLCSNLPITFCTLFFPVFFPIIYLERIGY